MVKVNPYIVYSLYQYLYHDKHLLKEVIKVLNNYEDDIDEIKCFKMDTSNMLKLELKKFD